VHPPKRTWPWGAPLAMLFAMVLIATLCAFAIGI
jgi:hypothetical protein